MSPELETLALRAREGERIALEELLRRTDADLRRVAQRACRIEDAEDAVQHAMLTAASQLGTLRAARRFTGWMFTIIRNECARYLRRAASVVQRDAEPVSREADGPHAQVRDAEIGRRLSDAVTSLTPSLRRVYVMRDVEGRSTREVATLLDIREGAVKVRLHRARAELRDHLADLVE